MKTKLVSFILCSLLLGAMPTHTDAAIDKNKLALIGGLSGAGLSAIALYLCYKKSQQITKLIANDYRALAMTVDEENLERLRKKRQWYRLGMGTSGIAIPLCLIIAAIGARNLWKDNDERGSGGNNNSANGDNENNENENNEFTRRHTVFSRDLVRNKNTPYKIHFQKNSFKIKDKKTNKDLLTIQEKEIDRLMYNVNLINEDKTYTKNQYLQKFYNAAEEMQIKMISGKQPSDYRKAIIFHLPTTFEEGYNKIENESKGKPNKLEQLVVALNYEAVKNNQSWFGKTFKGIWPYKPLPKEKKVEN